MAGLNFRRRKKRINMKVLQEALMWAGEVVLAFGFACVLVYFFGAALSNVGQSMEPAIYSGDRVLINRLIYRVKAPTYGDLIVFKPNGNENAHYHILGDNRNNSEDSRSADIGNVRREDIMGMAWFNVTPGERFGWLP